MSERDPHEEEASRRAEGLLEHPAAAQRLADRAAGRADRFSARLGDAVEELKALARMVRAWATGRYRALPTASLLAALGALIYFLMPLDALPDFIVGLGFADDLAVLARVVHHIRNDLAAFRDWESAREQEAEKGRDYPDV
jgi:uncharacterized membrane protein YkvA (DUF1232 family)